MRAFLSLGSNLGSRFGDRPETLVWGVQALVVAGVGRVARVSSIFRTEPVGLRSQPEFANLVVEIDAVLSRHELHRACVGVERAAGRERGPTDGPRTLDIDILLLDALVTTETETSLTVPHPRMHRRRFVLVPLAEIAPDVHHPTLGLSVGQLLADLEDESLVVLWRERRSVEAAIERALGAPTPTVVAESAC